MATRKILKWKTLKHNGILFPPQHESKNITIKIRGRQAELDLLQNEMIYQWAKKKDTPYVLDKTFRENFTRDFARTLGKEFTGLRYEDIDFESAYKLVDQEKAEKEMMTKEEKKALAARRKEIREELKAKYGKAIMNGEEVEVGNYMAEPPGIFIGRGAHPLRGRWKRRITHKDVTLNLDKAADVPPGDWGRIAHNREATWLASWTDDLTKQTKYVWLADTAAVKQRSDKSKYDKAVGLSKSIQKIRRQMISDMKSTDTKKSDIATACYLIYRTAMRVGDEKNPDEADTVGATTLRREHIRITSDGVHFDFLGKDSVRWQETVPAVGDDVQFIDNLRRLISTKKSDEEIFHEITSRNVNKYFSGIVSGLTAKVFRTYLASSKVAEYLRQHDDIKPFPPYKKIHLAKLANLEAAVMCNHKRTIPASFEKSLQKKRDTLESLKRMKPWSKTSATLSTVKASEPKTDKQKANKNKRIKNLNKIIRVKKKRHKERMEKIKLQIDLAEQTRDYNLGTSLRNYIDPRIFKSWTSQVDVEWTKLYTAALQKKFLWVQNERGTWKNMSAKY